MIKPSNRYVMITLKIALLKFTCHSSVISRQKILKKVQFVFLKNNNGNCIIMHANRNTHNKLQTKPHKNDKNNIKLNAPKTQQQISFPNAEWTDEQASAR